MKVSATALAQAIAQRKSGEDLVIAGVDDSFDEDARLMADIVAALEEVGFFTESPMKQSFTTGNA